jgi:hypothetical protein
MVERRRRGVRRLQRRRAQEFASHQTREWNENERKTFVTSPVGVRTAVGLRLPEDRRKTGRRD